MQRNSNFEYKVEDLRKSLDENLVPVGADSLTDLLDFRCVGQPFMQMLNSTLAAFFESRWQFCTDRCITLLNIVWERLNTGHWKDVPLTWRVAYTIVSFVKALTEFALTRRTPDTDVRPAIKTCDMGLLMGAPIMDNILSKLASKLQQIYSADKHISDVGCAPSKKLKLELSLPTVRKQPSVTIGVCPSIEHFQKNFMDKELPVVIRDCIDFWPAMGTRRWNLDYIRRIAGCRIVPVEIGSKYTEDSWSQSLMTVDDFIDKYIESKDATNDVAYLAQHQLFDQIPELRNDFSVPAYCALGSSDDIDINAWFGPAGTISPLHQDAKHNFLAQVVGEKYVRLYSNKFRERLYPHESHLLATTSKVDIDNPELDKYPLFEGLPYLDCVLSPGEMLYLPPLYWHYIRALSQSFSVSFWWT